MLGLPRLTLFYKMRRLGISVACAAKVDCAQESDPRLN